VRFRVLCNGFFLRVVGFARVFGLRLNFVNWLSRVSYFLVFYLGKGGFSKQYLYQKHFIQLSN